MPCLCDATFERNALACIALHAGVSWSYKYIAPTGLCKESQTKFHNLLGMTNLFAFSLFLSC